MLLQSNFSNGQGLGNQLWTYATISSVAAEYGLDFCLENLHLFKGKNFIDLNVNNTAKSDLGTILFNPDIQNYTLIEHHKKTLKKNIIVDNIRSPFSDCNSFGVVHIRGGDYFYSDGLLSKHYYNKALDLACSINSELKFYIVTDDYKYSQYIFPNLEFVGGARIHERDGSQAIHHLGGDVRVDFNLIKNATIKIISNSTFSWWASWLGDDESIIIAPKYWMNNGRSKNSWRPNRMNFNQENWIWI